MPKGDTSRPYNTRIKTLSKVLPAAAVRTSEADEQTRQTMKAAGAGRRVSPAPKADPFIGMPPTKGRK